MALKDLVQYITASLVDNPHSVEVSENSGARSLTLEIRVADGDRGKVIGKEGRIIKAIRVIANAASARHDKRAAVEIIE